jgi:metal-dependent hydrolase (beta-lactamase superfamily II)
LRAFSVLVSNFAGRIELPAQHGLSLYIRMDETDIIFDTGRDDLFLYNSGFMNLPVNGIKYTVISHIHEDHTGGIPYLSRHFSMAGRPCTIVCPADYEFLPLPAIKRQVIENEEKLAEGIHVFATQILDETREKMEELSLIAGSTLFVGCGHSGIHRILEKGLGLAKIDTIAGGFHNFNQRSSELLSTARFLTDSGIKKCILLHCTSMNFIRHLEDAGIECKVGYVGHCYEI